MKAESKWIEDNMWIVRTVVKQYGYLNMEEDLMQEGAIGLIEAGRRYDATMGITLESYAAWWVRKYVCDAVRRYGHLVTMPERKKAGDSLPPPISLDQIVGEEDGDEITLADTIADDVELEAQMDKHLLEKTLLGILSDREQRLVRFYYGLGGEQLSMKEIAAEMTLNFWNAHKILERAVGKMQKKYAEMSKKAENVGI